MSNSKTETCGFFEDPNDSNYGASPDALAVSPFILEVKTRPAKTEGPLSSLKQMPSYYIQPQLEMVCTGTPYCVLESLITLKHNKHHFSLYEDRQCFNVSYKGHHKQYLN